MSAAPKGFAITPEGMVVSSKSLKSTKAAAKLAEAFIRTLPVPRTIEMLRRRCSDTCPGACVSFVDGVRPEPRGARVGEYEIERCDDCGAFEDDSEAIRFLLALGTPGVPSCRSCFSPLKLHQCSSGDNGCMHCDKCGAMYPEKGGSMYPRLR